VKNTARAILINRKDRCLFVQHDEWNPADRGKWATVGGRVEDGESHEACLRREIMEEFGLSVCNKIEIGPKIFENTGKDRLDHFYVVWFEGDDVVIEAVDEILSHQWCSLDEARRLNFFFGFEADLFEKALSLSR
jgi:8-oxo-dGTP pyrophosphatase MutT (NUDIX family)